MKKIKLTEREFNAAVNTAYMDGYNKGKSHGRREAIGEKVTPNMLRKYIGLPPINNNTGEKE